MFNEQSSTTKPQAAVRGIKFRELNSWFSGKYLKSFEKWPIGALERTQYFRERKRT